MSTKSNNILFIINPISGGKNKELIPSQIEKYYKKRSQTSIKIVFTRHKNHAFQIAKEALNDYAIIVAIGGDGTINEIGKALINTNVTLGIIPLGSGNGLAFGLNYPKFKKIEAYLEFIQKRSIIKIDTARINDDIFLNIAGFGFDGYISYQFDIQAKRGLINYTLLSIKSFFSFSPFDLSISINKEKNKIFKNILLVGIANGKEFGNHFTIAPKANFSDQKLELILIKKPPLFALPKFTYQMRWGNLMNSKYVKYFSINQAQMECNQKQYANIDGEYSDKQKNFSIHLHPSSLSIIIP